MTFIEAFEAGDCFDCEHDPARCQFEGNCKSYDQREETQRKYKEMLEFNGRREERDI